MKTDLRFLGEWTLWASVLAGLVLACLVWRLYRRETRRRGDFLSWLLPLLRAMAVFWLFIILSGPVLHHRRIEGELARVLMFVDASQSMNLADPQMETGRKLLIAQQFGWLKAGELNMILEQAARRLDKALDDALGVNASVPAERIELLSPEFSKGVREAWKLAQQVPPDVWEAADEVLRQRERDLVLPAEKLTAREIGRDREQWLAEFESLRRIAQNLRDTMRTAFGDYLARTASTRKEELAEMVKRFDEMSRWDRMQRLLLDGEQSLLLRLGESHDVQLASLAGSEAEVLWWPSSGDALGIAEVGAKLQTAITNRSTDLSSGIQSLVEEVRGEDQVAVVVFSDGQHNSGPSPLNTARMLANRGIPMFVVGMGTEIRAPDLAILDVDMPRTVFHEANVKGTIQLKDDMKPGEKFSVSIRYHDVLLWEEELATEGRSQRAVPFDFSIKELVRRRLQSQDNDLKFGAMPVELQVGVSELPGETDVSNNRTEVRFSAITEKPRVLLIEGRPRWEFRYLRNLLERDQFWEINTLLAGAGGELKQWKRGDLPGQFPGDKETLFGYQLICFGDVPRGMLRQHEMEWIREFVENSGGGILMIDGRQTKLSSYADTPLGELMPVKWAGTPLTGTEIRLKFAAGRTVADPVSLVNDTVRNEEVWAVLPAPRYVAAVEALPGSEPLIQAVLGPIVSDAVTYRRQGAGQVVYIGFDESWRWRKDVGDLYHAKFWNQLSKYIMEPAFPVQDQYVSLDTGAVVYEPGETATIRARFRDANGRLILQAKAEAVLEKDGRKIATVGLEADENAGGTFRGRTPPLEEGDYRVRIEVDGLPPQEMKALTEFTVKPKGGGELAQLHANETLLREMAHHSGGQYLREEAIDVLRDQLKPLSSGKIVETETVLWQSYWWFLPAIVLLTLEWALRKRAGML